MKLRAGIFPFSKEAFSLYWWLIDQNDRYSSIELIPPIGFGIEGQDISVIDNRMQIGVTLAKDFRCAIQRIDILFIPEIELNLKAKLKIIDQLVHVTESSMKEIVCLMNLNWEADSMLNSFCNELGIKLVSLGKNDCEEHESMDYHRLYRPRAAVIYIGEMVKGLNADEVVLILSNALINRGIRNVIIGTDSIYEYIPNAIRAEYLASEYKVSEKERITLLNKDIKKLEKQNKPDIIIVRVPGIVLRFNEFMYSNLGITTYILSQMLQPDYFVLCCPFGEFNTAFYELLSQDFMNRYGMSIDFVHMSNRHLVMYEPNSEKESEVPTYLNGRETNNIMNKLKDTCRIPIDNATIKEGIDHLVTDILFKLGGEVDE